LAVGDYTVTVTQASAGATVTGDSLSSTVEIGAGAALKIALDAGGTEIKTIQLAEGTYSRSALAEMITTASGGTLRATITGDGQLSLTTTREGSAAHLAVQADTDPAVLTALNLNSAAGQPASQGTDGKIKFGDSAEVLVTDTAGTTDINANGATITASFSGGVRIGSVTAKQVSTGDGTLAAVVSAVNGANAGMTAAAVQVSPGVYKLQVASKTTGLSGALTFGADAFGAMETLTDASDAQLTIGGTLRVTSASNTFADVLPGVTLTATKADAAPVTLNVASDSGALADKVGKLVEAVNGVFSYVKLQGSYNAETKDAGPLLGDALARRVTGDLYRELGQVGVDLRTAGLSLTKEGLLSFDRAAFTAAYEQDPAAVAAFFHDGGTTTDTADDGLGKRLESLAKRATDTVGGLITGAINGRKTEVSTIERQIADWDVRLARKEANLRRQFAGLETALSNLRSQSTWLAGQLAGLAGPSS
jgi:flagellar hook-associated protein 2